MGHRLLQSVIVCTMLAGSSSWADEAPPVDTSNQWHFTVTPYIWLPNVGGSLRFSLPGDREANASTGPYDYLQKLRFAAMLQGEARKGDWSIFGDAIYLNFGDHSSAVTTKGSGPFGRETTSNAETTLKGALIQLERLRPYRIARRVRSLWPKVLVGWQAGFRPKQPFE